jgi:hypothetical protein
MSPNKFYKSMGRDGWFFQHNTETCHRVDIYDRRSTPLARFYRASRAS